MYGNPASPGMKVMDRPPVRVCSVVRAGLALMLLMSLAGCGTQMRPVEGQVLFKDGQPLAGGLVVFERVEPAEPRVSARGHVEPDGRFRLSTYKQADGAPEGRYRVTVAPPLPVDPNDLGQRILHPKYESVETSGLEYEVTSGTNEFRITVERP